MVIEFGLTSRAFLSIFVSQIFDDGEMFLESLLFYYDRLDGADSQVVRQFAINN